MRRTDASKVATAARRHRMRSIAVQRAIAFMNAHLTESMTLDVLAASAGVSRFHFARVFRMSTGHSPMTYLMRLRVQRSQPLLEHGTHSICEIAALFGFCDQSHFTRTFRKVTGMPPREYAALSPSRPHTSRVLAMSAQPLGQTSTQPSYENHHELSEHRAAH